MTKPYEPERRDLLGSAPTARGRTISGYACLFNKRSQNLGTSSAPWFEEIAPGSFPDLKTQDCRALFNHESSAILARSKYGKGTLQLRIDGTGVFYQFEAPKTQGGEDLLVSIARGDIDQSSFSFVVEKDEWRNEGKSRIRRILKISQLLDVSPVAFPAYQDTTATARNRSKANPPTGITGPDEALISRYI